MKHLIYFRKSIFQIPLFHLASKIKNRNFVKSKINLILFIPLILISFFAFPSKLVGQNCGTPDSSTDMLAAYPSQKKVGNDGPFYIKIYPFIVRESDGSAGATEASVILALAEMKNDFKDFNIFFHYSCINYIDDSAVYLDPETGLANFTELEDGISLLLVDQVFGNIAGKSGIPGRKLFSVLGGTSLSHEMGHALGLYHTHQGASCANGGSLNELVNGSNCTTAGDFLCATKAAPDFAAAGGVNGSCVYSNSTCRDPNNQPYVDADPKNLMSYGGLCRDYFVAGQGEKMRNTLALAAELADVQRNWAYITGTKTINDPQYSDVDIIITAGSTLNFNDVLEMAPKTRIVLEKSARLNTDGAHITVGAEDENCPTTDPLWGGIFLSSGAYYEYSKATLLNSIIENANTALTWLNPNYQVINGRVVASNTLFKNNKTAVHFYLKFPPTATPANLNSFSRCNFEIDNSYLGTEFNEQIYLIYAGNITILQDCKVTNNRTSLISGRNYGINTYASRLLMVDNSLTYQKSEISKFAVGINSFKGTTFTPTFLARNTEFNLNTTGINSRSLNNLNIYDCLFTVPSTSGGYAGISNNAGTGFMIYDNEFTSSTSTVANKFGIRLFGTTSESNLIDENTFNNMGTANIASGTNGGLLTGLQYLCNTVTNSNQFDFYVSSSSSIALTQGSSSASAGNRFTQRSLPAGSDFFNGANNTQVKYLYNGNDPIQEPKNVLNISKLGQSVNSDCDYRSIREQSLSSLDESYEETYEVYDSILQLFNVTAAGTLKDRRGGIVRELNLRLMVICNSAISLINSDTTSIDWSDLRGWLSLKNSFASDIDQATTYLSENDSTGFVSFRNSMPGRRTFTSEDSTDYGLFVDLTNLLSSAKSDMRSEADLDSVELLDLIDIAETNNRTVAGMAKNILETFYNHSYLDTIGLRSEKPLMPESRESVIRVFPQPSSDVVKMEFPVSNNKILISSITGTPIINYTCNECSSYTWYVSAIPTGIYSYNIISLTGNYSGTIVISH